MRKLLLLRALRPLLGLIPLFAALVILYLLESSSTVEPPTSKTESAQLKVERRLFIVWVDALARADIERLPHLPKLKARLDQALHGPVRSCADATSVPCFSAMSTGRDSFSLFSVLRNLEGLGQVPSGSVFHDLQVQGLRLGIVAKSQLLVAAEGFDWLEEISKPDDALTMERAQAALEQEQIQLMIFHMNEVDEASHAYGPSSPQFYQAMSHTDELLEQLFALARPEDHIVVMGDHGHTPDGRHFAGLDVPSYAAYFGPAFQRHLKLPMAMTDHASIWAKIFGLRFEEEVPWVEAYFSGAALPEFEPKDTPNQRSIDLPPLAGQSSEMPLWVLLLSLLGILLLVAPIQDLRKRQPVGIWIALLFLAILVGVLGSNWVEFRTLLYFRSRAFNTSFGLGVGFLGALLLALGLWPSQPMREHFGRFGLLIALGALLLALPTVYKFGGLYTGVTGLYVLLLFALLGELKQGAWRESLWLLAFLALLFLIWNPSVRNFVVRNYYYLDLIRSLLGPWSPPLFVALALLSVAFVPQQRRSSALLWLGGGGLGLSLAIFSVQLPPKLLILPCALASPLLILALRRPNLAPLALILAFPAQAFLFNFNSEVMTPVALSLLLWPLWVKARPQASSLERGLLIILLIWLSLWAILGARLSGLNFNYFFKWFEGDGSVEDAWILNVILTNSLYLSLSLTGALMARRINPEALALGLLPAKALGQLKLALVLIFVATFSFSPDQAGPFIVSDTLQESALWILLLLYLGLLSLGVPQEEQRLAER